MSSSYDPSDLQGTDPTSEAWALAWARFLLRDTVVPFAYEDAEVEAVLTSTAFTHSGSTYYRPHVAAAALVESDPDRPISESLLSASVTHRSGGSIARGIRTSGAWVDDLIEAATGGTRPASRTTLVPTF